MLSFSLEILGDESQLWNPQAACSALHSEHDRNATIVAMGMEDLAAKAT